MLFWHSTGMVSGILPEHFIHDAVYLPVTGEKPTSKRMRGDVV